MFRLAGHLGRTVGELDASLSYDEFMEWQAYDRLDPIGGYRADLQTAHLLYAYYRSMGGGDDSVGIGDFLPIDPNPMTDEQRERLADERHKAELDACMTRLVMGLGKGD